MAGEDTTKSTPFIVGMVFFGIGVILLIAIIVFVMYFCIYRRRKNQFEKKKYLTMDNSIIYTKSPPSLDLRPPSISREVNENGNIQSMTTMSPLESPNTIYTVNHGPPTPDTVFVSGHDQPTKLSQSFDTVDHHSNGKKYVLTEVYAVDGGTMKKKNKGHKTNKNKQHRVGKAHSSYHSWNNRTVGGGSLPRTKPRKDKYAARSERGYRTTGFTNSAYHHHHHTDTLGNSSKKSHKGYYGSAPNLVRLQPVSFATMPTRVSSSSSQRMYLVSENPRPVVSGQSVILNRSPPRSPRSPRFAVAHSLDGYNNYDDHDHLVMKSRSHNTSRDYSASLSRDNSTDGNFLKWSPSMKRKLEDKGGRVSRSNSDLTSISRTGRKRGIGEHKYIYDPKQGTLEQF